jgi:type IV pilus assembly protein PilM
MVNGALRGKSRNRVGLDIGSHSVKIAELSGTSDKLTVVSFGARKISGLSKDAVAASVKSLANETGVSSREAVISVSGPSLIVRLISMPKMTDDELAGAVRFEAEKFIPFDINDCILDFHILNKASKEKNDSDILLAAAKKEHVLQKIRTVESAGFAVKAVDADIFAVMNSFLNNYTPSEQSKTAALLNVGASSTALSILSGKMPVFVREIPSGGSDMSAAIAKNIGLSQDLAEELKLAPKDRSEDVAVSVRPVVTKLLDEIKLSFGYYENQSGRGIDEIYVSGGGALMAGLENSFQEAFGSKPIYWDPFRSLEKTPSGADNKSADAVNGSYAVAMGLALR